MDKKKAHDKNMDFRHVLYKNNFKLFYLGDIYYYNSHFTSFGKIVVFVH